MPAVFDVWKKVNYDPEQWQLTYLTRYGTGSWTSAGRVMVYEMKMIQKYYASDGELISTNYYNDQFDYLPSAYMVYVRPVAD